MTLPDFVRPLGHGIHAIDTAHVREHFDAAYLIVDAGEAAFVDTGTQLAVPRLLAALDALGLARSAVRWVVPTHVHLDHAGGTGGLMQALPQARAVVHPQGLRHLVDPRVLWASATRVYGEATMRAQYGELVPLSAQRAQASHDGQQLPLGQRTLRLLDTPGHARHHHCVWDSAAHTWFTGDTFGLSYRELDSADGRAWLLPSSTPTQFDPVALRASIGRLLAAEPQSVHLTHFGRIGRDADEVRQLAAGMLDLAEAMTALALSVRAMPPEARHRELVQRLMALYQRSVAAHGCPLPTAAVAEVLATDATLNAQGLAVWLDHLPATAAAS